MRRVKLLFLVMAAMWCCNAVASGFANETLHYVVQYKWGLISKDTGDVAISLRNSGSDYKITLTGRTRNWADKYYTLRDTLHSTIAKQGLRPKSYTRIAHEGGKYARDQINYSYAGNVVKGACTRRKIKKGKESTASITLTGSTPTYDMLSILYYLRSLDYAAMTSGKKTVVTMFSGKKKETLTLTYQGRQNVTLRDGKKRDAFKVTFRFTTGGNKKSSEDISAWLSTSAGHIPLLIEGSLPVGKVKAYYVG